MALILRNEFRAVILDDNQTVAFIPSDSAGQRVTGMTIRLHDPEAVRIVAGWSITDPIFYFDESDGRNHDSGFLNQTNQERVTIFSHHPPS